MPLFSPVPLFLQLWISNIHFLHLDKSEVSNINRGLAKFWCGQSNETTTPVQPRVDCFKNAGIPCRLIFWVNLSLILAGFSCLMLGTVRPKCLTIDFLFVFSRDFANYTFWKTCHKFYNVSNCLILKFFCSQHLLMLLLDQ